MRNFILFLLLSVMVISLFGCFSLFSRKLKSDTEITVPPTPGVQLWQAARSSNWLVTLSILGIAGGVFAIANGSGKLGSATAAGSSVSLFLALAVARYAAWMAVMGLIASIAAVLFSILVRRRALVEIIKGVQNFKSAERLDPEGNQTQLLRNRLKEQSNTTKKIVGNIKNELKLKGAI